MEQKSELHRFAEDYLRRWSRLDPRAAAAIGLPSPPGELSDLSPDGQEALAQLARQTLHELPRVRVASRRDRVAAATMADRLESSLALHEAGEHYRSLRVIGSPLDATRQLFDLLPTSSEADWEDLAARAEKVGWALSGYRATLLAGVERHLTASRRQALAVATQARAYAGTAQRPGYFRRLASRYSGTDERLHRRLEHAAAAADGAFGELAGFLADEYAALADERDGVGPERYRLWARQVVGAALDPVETYNWGVDELARIRSEMDSTARRVVPGADLDAAVRHLETDPDRSIEGVDAFVAFLQQTMDEAIEALDGRHFDIPGPVRRVEAMVAPEGTAAAMYYTRPSPDFSRPGRTWYPTLGKTRFPTWIEISTAYHEGVPGHHLQLGYSNWLGERLNPFQLRLGSVSGHVEGWALYAERLMDELGFLAEPGARLGMLAGQAMRAARVVVDIGLHLGLAVPDGMPGAGGPWTPELAHALLVEVARRDPAMLASEVDRYLGWPAQAISYKVGERCWLEARERARRAGGASFSLKAFHAEAFELGLVSLDTMAAELDPGRAEPAADAAEPTA